MAEKKGVILIRFPDELADKLRRVSFELNVPIKDIVSEIVDDNLEYWAGTRFIEKVNEFAKATDTTLERVLGRTVDQAFIDKLGTKFSRIKESEKQLRKAAEMVKHGVLPIEVLFQGNEEPKPENPASKGRPKKPRNNPETKK